jgi:hypothetical protein
MGNEVHEVRKFAALIDSLEDGRLDAELSLKLHELNTKIARQAEELGKAKGEIKLTLKLEAESGGTMQIAADWSIKEPKPQRVRSVMWLTAKSHLTAANPKQQKLPLAEVPMRKEAPVDVGADKRGTQSV